MAEKRRTRKKVEEKPLAEQVRESAKKAIEKPRELKEEDLVPTGSTLLNCACSNNPFGGYGLGKIVTLPGGSQSGKTLLVLTALAEINALKRFAEYDLYYDDVEQALEFDVGYIFDQHLPRDIMPLAERLMPPLEDEDGPIYSDTIQDLKSNIFRLASEDKPIIYVADSLDALSSDEELEKEYKMAIARAKSEEAVKALTGSYNTEKAKIMGQTLRMIKKRLADTDSLLIVIQQIRQKIGVVFGKQSTTSGGNAPFFYSTHQVWLTKTKTYKDSKHGFKIGTRVEADVVKNKLTGTERTIEFDTYKDYGVDDITSCVEYLIDTKHWKPVTGKQRIFNAGDLGIQGDKSRLVEQIETARLETELRTIVGKVWNEIEDEIRMERKRRFGK